MLRQLALILLAVSILGTVACERQSRRVSIQRTLTGNENGFDAQMKAAREESAKTQCLRLDRIARAFSSADKDELRLYVRNTDLGTLSDDLQFSPTDRRSLVAKVLLNGARSNLLLERPRAMKASGGVVTAGSLARFLNVIAIEEDCGLVKTRSRRADLEYGVLDRDQNSITLQHNGSGEIAHYELSESGSLILSIYLPTEKVELCGQELPPIAMTTFVLSAEQNDRAVITESFATLIADYARHGRDVRELMMETDFKTTNGTLVLPFDLYQEVVETEYRPEVCE